MPDDAQLLRRYAEENSEAAFTELVSRHLDLVYSAALRQVGGDVHRAQDVAQTVFLALARKAAALARHPVLIGWLYTSTQHAAAKVRRTEGRRRMREHEAHLMQLLTSSASSAADWEQLRPVLDEAMRELADCDREAVLLRFFARRPFADIGAALNLSEDGARMRVDRALEKLHALLARRGVTSTATALGLVLANQAVTAAPAGLTTIVCNGALAQLTAAGGGTAAGVLTFMSTTKFTAVLAVALAILAVGTATREVLSRRAAVASLAVASQEAAALSARLSELTQRVQTAEQDRTELQRSLDEARSTATAAATGTAKPAPDAPAAKTLVATADQITAGDAFLTRHPELKQALVDRSRARVDSRFRPLYRQLNLTLAQIERFENLLIEGEGVNMGNSITGPMVLRPGTGLTHDEVDQQVHDLLGDAGYQQYQAASQLARGRQFALQVAGALYFTDTPLTSEQSNQLAQITEAARIETRDAKGTRDDYWNSVLTKAQGLLAEPQLTVLAGFQQQEQFQAELSRAQAGWMLPGWTGANSKPKPPGK